MLHASNNILNIKYLKKSFTDFKQSMSRAHPSQVGKAAKIRFEFQPQGTDRVILNGIIHSADRPSPRNNYQKDNPFFDPSKSFDEKAQKELDRMEGKYK